METEDVDLVPMDRGECLRLLSTARIGRLGLHERALPLVLPVAFTVDGDGIVLRVRRGSRLDGLTHDAVVAFEADDMDPPDGLPWWVGVTGVATDVADIHEPEGRASVPTEPRSADTADRFVRISLDLVSGQRAPLPLPEPQDAESPLGTVRSVQAAA